VLAARREVAEIHVEEMLERYVVSLVTATRKLGELNAEWKDYLVAGASPRASIALLRAAAALAYLRGRDYLTPEDIMDMAPDVLRHRLILGYPARAANVGADEIIKHLLAAIPVP
jgi:MoxR-like ATPase